MLLTCFKFKTVLNHVSQLTWAINAAELLDGIIAIFLVVGQDTNHNLDIWVHMLPQSHQVRLVSVVRKLQPEADKWKRSQQAYGTGL